MLIVNDRHLIHSAFSSLMPLRRALCHPSAEAAPLTHPNSSSPMYLC